MSKFHDLAVELAVAELGVKEDKVNGHYNNRGARVDEYQRADDLAGEGYAWCDSFAGAWLPIQIGKKLGVTIPGVRSASCDRTWADARTRGLVRATPQPGYQFIVRANLGGRYSSSDGIHTGVVEEVHKDTFGGIEGNTNADGGREGYAVMRHTRDISSRYVFIDPYANLSAPGPVIVHPIVEAWRITLQGKGAPKAFDVMAFNGRPMIATRDFAEFYGIPLGWKPEDNVATLAGVEVPTQVRLINGKSFYPIRILGEMSGLKVLADGGSKTVVVTQ